MDITFPCFNCGQELTVDESGAGLTVPCPECGHNLTIPAPPAAKEVSDRQRLGELRANAESGDAKAQNELGACYDLGQGVTKDMVEAVKWYRKAAEQNDAMGQFNLGTCYDSGEGVAKDEAEAVKWYRKAAEQNVVKAQYNLGLCYENGEGVTKDEAEAVKWMALAAAQGWKDATAAIPWIEDNIPQEQIAEGERRAIEWLEQRKRVTVTTPQA